MVEAKEMVISGILAAVQQELGKIQLQMLEQALRENLREYSLEKECTELSTGLDDNLHILKVFAANKKLEGCVERSIEQYIRSNQQFLEWANKNYRNITKDDVKFYLALYGQGKKQNTVANMKRYLGTFYGWAHDEGYIAMNPVKTIKGIKPEVIETKYLSVEEEIAVRDTVGKGSERDIAIIDVLLSTGLRVGEMEALNRRDVDLRDGSITLQSEKSKKYRTVYLEVRAKKHLEEYLASRQDTNEALFLTKRKYRNEFGGMEQKRMTKQSYEQLTKSVCKQAGILDKDCTVHVFRKTFATRLAERGCPLEVIQELLGHADAGTTSKHYVAKSKQRLKRATEQYLLAA